jgi:hypothetical protein
LNKSDFKNLKLKTKNYQEVYRMKRRKEFLSTIITTLLLAMPLIGVAQESREKSAPQIVTIEPAKKNTPIPLAGLLPEKLGGIKASSEAQERQAENLNEVVSDQATIYREYRVIAAAVRTYGNLRVEVFQMDTPDSAFGAYTHRAGDFLSKVPTKEIGSNSAVLTDAVIFWKQNYFVRVVSAETSKPVSAVHSNLAFEVAKNISANDAPVERPVLLNSLPKNYLARSERYFLGAESLNPYFEHGREIFSFDGDAEATVAEYRKPDAPSTQAGAEKKASAKQMSATPVAKPLKLVIVEYHTPQFATQADTRATAYLTSLSEEEQSRIMVKRIGNFLVGATGFEDREFAEQLINSIEYPYVVKWLQNPAIPTRDPFHEQKVAQVILSSFSLVGLASVIMMTGGLIVGTLVFLRRRKQSRETFSDAGGMLRLQLDPIENIILGLPAKRSDE